MESKPFPYYIEDWILWIGCRRDTLGNTIDFSYYYTPPVKLANYDVNFVTRSAEAVERGMGFTDRQLATAAKIVAKYRKQILSKIDVDPEYLLHTTPHRLELRKVNRSFSVRKQHNHYIVKFPYNPEMVNAMHENVAVSPGEFVWIKQERHWQIAAVEANLSLLCNFVDSFRQHSWEIDAESEADFHALRSARCNPLEHVPYLDIDAHSKLTVFNANPDLSAALEDFDWSLDLANAAFRADNYGMRTGPALQNYIKTNHNSIHRAVLATQSEILHDCKSLGQCLTINNLAQFMQTIHADLWVFPSAPGKSNHLLEKYAKDVVVSGEKLFYLTSSVTLTTEYFQSLLDDLKQRDLSTVVVFVDSSILAGPLSRLLQKLDKPLLRLIYLYS